MFVKLVYDKYQLNCLKYMRFHLGDIEMKSAWNRAQVDATSDFLPWFAQGGTVDLCVEDLGNSNRLPTNLALFDESHVDVMR